MDSSHTVEVSVITATYNRAHTLPYGYASLQEQTFRDFEWIVVDDGSTDSTPQLIQEWRAHSSFPIMYVRQENLGKHVARNRAVEIAHGRFAVDLDSDDWLTPNALQRLRQVWDSIPPQCRDSFVGVAGRDSFTDGTKVGPDLPTHFLDSDEIELRWRFRITSDNTGLNRIDTLRAFPAPEFENEKYVPDAVAINRIARQYKTRYFDEIVAVANYQKGGLSDRIKLITMQNPSASLLYYKELLDVSDRLNGRARFRASANFVRFSLHDGRPLWRTWCGNDIWMWLTSLPAAVVLWARDRRMWRQATHLRSGRP